MSSVSKSTVALPQRTRARVQREVIGLLKNAPEGIKLIVDPETGLPPSLNEITVRHALALFSKENEISKASHVSDFIKRIAYNSCSPI